MTDLKLAYVQRYRVNGKLYFYFRKPGQKRVRLVGLPGSAEFMTSYQDALSGITAPPVEIGAGRVRPRSIDALVIRYYASAAFVQLAPSTQATYRGALERFRNKYGDRLVASLQRKHIKAMMDRQADAPAAANMTLKMLRLLMPLAIDMEWRKDDPTAGIKRLRVKGDGFHSWTEDEIAAFEKRHPVGTRPRLAMALLLYTGQRRSDVVGMGWPAVRGERIAVTQQKTGKALLIPMHDDLAAILAQTPRANITFITTDHGAPYTAAGFGNWFRERCDEAGLPQCSAHGLRKAAARRLAEAGCSSKQIAAVTGHTSLREVERYVAAAEQARLADDAVASLYRPKPEHPVSKAANDLDTTTSNPYDLKGFSDESGGHGGIRTLDTAHHRILP